MIKEFHEKFGLAYFGPPKNLDFAVSEFRTQFMDEELAEYIFATTINDLEKQLDALVDLVYVALGTAYMQGFDFNEAFRRVHEANMKKVRAVSADHSLRNNILDVVKPEGWQAPDLSDLINAVKSVSGDDNAE
jgi:predicted HAD superfamily Cof-like phosphohydrolase